MPGPAIVVLEAPVAKFDVSGRLLSMSQPENGNLVTRLDLIVRASNGQPQQFSATFNSGIGSDEAGPIGITFKPGTHSMLCPAGYGVRSCCLFTASKADVIQALRSLANEIEGA